MLRLGEWFSRTAYDPTTGRPSTEPPQAAIRLAAGIVFLSVIGFHVLLGSRDPTALVEPRTLLAMGCWALFVAIVVFWHTMTYRKPSVLRRTLAVSHDYLFISAIMLAGGQTLAFGLLLLAWLSVGNGVRYGSKALLLSIPAACASFAVPAFFSPFWSAHPTLVVTSFGLLLVPCVYLFALIRSAASAHEAMERSTRARTVLQREVAAGVLRPLEAVADLAQTCSLALAPSLLAWEGRTLAHLHSTATLLADPLRTAAAPPAVSNRPIEVVESFLDPVRDLSRSFSRPLIARIEPDHWRGILVSPDRVIEIHVHAALLVATTPTSGTLLVEHHLLKEKPGYRRMLIRMGVVGETPESYSDPTQNARFHRLRSLASEFAGTARWEQGTTGYLIAAEFDLAVSMDPLPPPAPSPSYAVRIDLPDDQRAPIAAYLHARGHQVVDPNASRVDLVLVSAAALPDPAAFPAPVVAVLVDEDPSLELPLAQRGIDWVVGAAAHPERLDRLFLDAPHPAGFGLS